MLHQLTNKFLHRVRIHGGEFDSSARAMNRAGGKDTLITYEGLISSQADLRIVRGSTIERKNMSTKTTFKRVALVAVAALGLGVLSVAPSSAAPTITTTVAYDTATSTAVVGGQVTVQIMTDSNTVATNAATARATVVSSGVGSVVSCIYFEKIT